MTGATGSGWREPWPLRLQQYLLWHLRGIDLFGACVMGIITAIGGGLIRDVLADRQTLLMSRELYATPVMLGCTLYVVLLYLLPQYRFIGAVGCCLFIFAISAAAIHWQLSVPEWLTTKVKKNS